MEEFLDVKSIVSTEIGTLEGGSECSSSPRVVGSSLSGS